MLPNDDAEETRFEIDRQLVDCPSRNRARHEIDHTYRKADEYLNHLADMSGGVVERADSLQDLKGAFARIAEELRRQYLLGYYPTNREKDARDRKITVGVSRQGIKVRARPAYRAVQ